MALNKVVYEDNITVIRAKNLNDIQDNIISNKNEIDSKVNSSDIIEYTADEIQSLWDSVTV